MTAMKVVPLVQRLLDNWLLVGEFFASRNWPDTRLGNAARELNADMPRIVAALSAVEPAPDGLVDESVWENRFRAWFHYGGKGAHWGSTEGSWADKLDKILAEHPEMVIKATSPSRAIPDEQPVAWGIIAANTGKLSSVTLDKSETEDFAREHIVPLISALTSRAAVLEEAAKNDARLSEIIKAFVDKQEVRCAESIYQMDNVIENAYELLEQLITIVGYWQPAIRAAKGE